MAEGQVDFSQVNFRKKNKPVSSMKFDKLVQRVEALEKENEAIEKDFDSFKEGIIKIDKSLKDELVKANDSIQKSFENEIKDLKENNKALEKEIKALKKNNDNTGD